MTGGRRPSCAAGAAFAAAWALVSAGPGPARAADNVFLDLVVDGGGFLVGDADDRFLVSRDFLNASTATGSWSTDQAELVFRGGPAHRFTLAGADRGATAAGLTDNFAWGTLRLESGQSLELADGNATAGGAQYLRRLVLEDGVAQSAAVTGNGLFLYYDPQEPANAYLGGATFPLAGGGAIAPFAPEVPALSRAGRGAAATILAALGGLIVRRTRPRRDGLGRAAVRRRTDG